MDSFNYLQSAEVIARLEKLQADIDAIKRAMNLPVATIDFSVEDFENVSETVSNDEEPEEWLCSKCANKVGQFDKYCRNCGDRLEDE